MRTSQNQLKGVGVALVTPFTEDYQLDLASFEKLLAHTTNIGVDYWVIQGTTGESPTTTKHEKKTLLEFAKQNNPKNLPIVYGIGGNNTENLLQTIQETDFSGITAILSASPYYNKPSQAGIVAHYEKLAEASPVPIILYNVPGRTSSNLTAETTLKLAQHPNIIGIKEASGNLMQCMEIARQKPKDFLLISGDDMLTVPMISFGAVGVISVMANALKAFNDMTHYALTGDFTKATEKMFEILPLNDLMYVEGNPVGIKQLLNEMGICGSQVRLPLVKASQELAEKIRKAMQKL
ncbi:4-hydroxy-tetrahydrodipicolinate synthase [Raineya orbicola]|jgi:4-hydroxy-tetrahydrodipicolinate synthase|uniref:4-hydroxy-tetrahydrodipicolinate synthase n=1 Tax=Raineya orbicola TaxID=2016530 RepID=A0A2N3II58_9BACT|nr:4-hydroxy-tetrahydrodipicolinate synthase [Raineya orbicola]PKQ69938.1 dapA: dihydrodipicolinate synthase [Raineya orbicola]